MKQEQLAAYCRTLPMLPPREATGHKGSYGTVLGIGGSRGMAGAVALAGRAVLAAGAGLVRLAVPDPVLETVAGFYPEPTTIPCPADPNGRLSSDALKTLLEYAGSSTTVFVGPGLGRSAGLDRLVPLLLRRIARIERLRTVVVDADALNAVSMLPDRERDELFDVFRSQPGAPRVVLTPHPGEFARLTRGPVPAGDRSAERLDAARSFAARHHVVLVLKGHETIVSDGDRHAVNPTGNPGMATGGSGDVLTGVVTALSGRLADVFDAARLGVFLHGLAGDIAARRLGMESLVATSILEAIPAAFREIKIGKEQ